MFLQKIGCVLLVLMCIATTSQALENEMGNKLNGITFSLGYGLSNQPLFELLETDTSDGFYTIKLSYVEIKYTQPTTIFRVPAHRFLRIGYLNNLGAKVSGTELPYNSTLFASFGYGFAIKFWHNFSFSIDGGMGFHTFEKDKTRIPSFITYIFTQSISYHFTERQFVSFGFTHYSNGGVTVKHAGYDSMDIRYNLLW